MPVQIIVVAGHYQFPCEHCTLYEHTHVQREGRRERGRGGIQTIVLMEHFKVMHHEYDIQTSEVLDLCTMNMTFRLVKFWI